MGKKTKKKNKIRKKNQHEKIKSSLLRKQFSIGDSVMVKKGVIDPDYSDHIRGWQGRIYEIDDNASKSLVCFEWDSITIKYLMIIQYGLLTIDDAL